MEEFIKREKALIVSSIYFVLALLLAGYTTQYQQMEVFKTELDRVNRTMTQELAAFEEAKNKVQSNNKVAEKNGVTSMPTFLERINSIAKAHNVIIRKLSPENVDSNKFILTMVADYYTFIKFTSDLELRDVILDDLQIHPYDVSKTPPTHAISFALIPRNNAKPLTGERLVNANQWAKAKDLRNPFQRFAYDNTQKTVKPMIDLTWIYKLGGIGRNAEGKAQDATIDRISYRVGDKLEDKEITEIQADRVYLEKDSAQGKTKYVLKFRTINTGNAANKGH